MRHRESRHVLDMAQMEKASLSQDAMVYLHGARGGDHTCCAENTACNVFNQPT